MSWIFLPEGLLMPSAIPAKAWDDIQAKHPGVSGDVTDWVQVRARMKVHLTQFNEKYMHDQFVSDIDATPDMDYNYRYYTRKSSLAQGIARHVMNIDYTKFKPAAYDHDTRPSPYYNALNSIWGSVTALGAPGGKWSSASSYSGWKGNYRGGNRRVGSTFYESSTGYDGYYSQWGDLSEPEWHKDSGVPDYEPADEQLVEDLLEQLKDIPPEDWQEYCTDHEWDVIKGIAETEIRVKHEEGGFSEADFASLMLELEDAPDRRTSRSQAFKQAKQQNKKNRRRTREQYRNRAYRGR